jgi:AcrR family transcriptional regulator
MNKMEAVVRRRGDAEETRRRVLDTVMATIIDIGYYKASSNEIARRAGVTWGSIQHLFGSREQLMLDVVNDIGVDIERRFASAVVEGDSLEERLASVLKVLATHYEQDSYIVQMQILLELSANPNISLRHRRAIQRQSGDILDHLAQPLLAKAMGAIAAEHDLVIYAFLTMRGYLTSRAISRRISELPDGAIVKLIGKSEDDAILRELVVRAVANTVSEEAVRRGYKL